MTVGAGAALPGALDRPPATEDGLHEVRGALVGLGDDCRRPRPDESRGVVVDPLARDVERALRQSGLGIATRVAEVVEQDDCVLGELDLRSDDALAEVLMRRVAAACFRIEAETVLGRREERVAVLARPAVAVAHVDHKRGALDRLFHGRPRGVRRVDLDDVPGIAPRERRRGTCLRAVVARGGTSRAHDEDHLWNRLGGGRARRRCERGRREDTDRDQGRKESSAKTSHNSGHAPCGR